MKIQELIELADELVVNLFSTSVKLMLVNEVEGRVQQECFRIPADDVQVYTEQDIEDETALLLGPPWQQVYLSWMKAMYYWHMAEYDSYQNEKAMFDNEWRRLCREVAERQAYGTSDPPGGSLALSRRPLAYQYVLNEITYDGGSYSSEMSYDELTAALAKHALPICRVEDQHEIWYVPLVSVDAGAGVLSFDAQTLWMNSGQAYGVVVRVTISHEDQVTVSDEQLSF